MRLKQLVCSLVLIYFGNPQLDIQQKQTIENFRPWSRGMLNFDILVKGLGIVSPQQFCLRLLEKNVSRSVLVCPAPGPLLGSWLWPPSSGPNLYLPALVTNLYLPALAPNLYLPALVTSLYLPALALNLYLPALAPNLYLLPLALVFTDPDGNFASVGPGP